MSARHPALDGLGLGGEEQEAWIAELAALGPTEGGIRLPDDRRARELLARLGADPLDASDVLGARPDRDAQPWLWWLLERAYHQLLAGIDGTGRPPPWRQLPDRLGTAGAHLYPWLFLAAVPAARANHARRGVPDDVSWATLRDFGRQAALCRSTYGRGGLVAPNWLVLHFRGTLFELGRLQYQRSLEPLEKARAILPDASADTPVVDLHIPQAGPLTPELVDRSLARARDFFPRHFPEVRYGVAICTSWLLDEQLAEYLPETSNILAFQRRFHLLGDGVAEDDASVLEFVFRRPRTLPLREQDLASLPQQTALQRAIVTHLRAGRHWGWRTGWFEW